MIAKALDAQSTSEQGGSLTEAGTSEDEDLDIRESTDIDEPSSSGDRIAVATEDDFISKDARLRPERKIRFPLSGRSHLKPNVDYHKNAQNHYVPPHMWDYKCSICDREFYNRRNRDRHVREIHSGERKFKCTGCDRVFSREGNMERHRAQEHQDHRPVFKCDICDKVFTQVGSLRRHEVQIHTDPGRLKCPHCPATYARRQKLEAHMKSNKHHIKHYCKCCRQTIIFKSLKAKEEHCQVINLIPRSKWGPKPSTTLSCKNNPHPLKCSKNRDGYWLSLYKRK